MHKATLARSREGKIWMTSNGRVAVLEKGKVVPVVFPGDKDSDFHERVFAAADGGIWVLGNGRVRKWRNGKWEEEMGTGVTRTY